MSYGCMWPSQHMLCSPHRHMLARCCTACTPVQSVITRLNITTLSTLSQKQTLRLTAAARP